LHMLMGSKQNWYLSGFWSKRGPVGWPFPQAHTSTS